jgi:hypothetical protein
LRNASLSWADEFCRQEGVDHALDHMRDSLNSVVVGVGERPHGGRCHSYPAGHCHHRDTGPRHSGTKAIGNPVSPGRIRNIRSIPIPYGGSLLPWPTPRGARISAASLRQKGSAPSFPSWMRASPNVVSRPLSDTVDTLFHAETLEEALSP